VKCDLGVFRSTDVSPALCIEGSDARTSLRQRLFPKRRHAMSRRPELRNLFGRTAPQGTSCPEWAAVGESGLTGGGVVQISEAEDIPKRQKKNLEEK
jgi:hypothetical protein